MVVLLTGRSRHAPGPPPARPRPASADADRFPRRRGLSCTKQRLAQHGTPQPRSPDHHRHGLLARVPTRPAGARYGLAGTRAASSGRDGEAEARSYLAGHAEPGGATDFWKWLLLYRRRSRPVLRQAIAAHASDADVYVLPTPRAVRRFVAKIASGVPDSP
jgi:hypothetical protein